MPLICLAFVLIKLPAPIFLCWQKYCSVNYLKQINALSVLVVGSFTAQRKQRTKIKSNSFFCPNVLVTSLRCTFWAVVLIKLAVKEGQCKTFNYLPTSLLLFFIKAGKLASKFSASGVFVFVGCLP